jgi:putative transposase
LITHATGRRSRAHVERYNRTVRLEWLGQFTFNTIEKFKEHATSWLWTYNNQRPNIGIGGITPRNKTETYRVKSSNPTA